MGIFNVFKKKDSSKENAGRGILFNNDYFQRAVESPVESLQALKSEVAVLTKQHPKNPMASVPRAGTQIPWICRTLDEAISALQTKKDPFGNPITVSQISSGLRQLINMVRDPLYITQMEIAYAGIGKPLEDCMEKLAGILDNMR
jgi:hypothetical protein